MDENGSESAGHQQEAAEEEVPDRHFPGDAVCSLVALYMQDWGLRAVFGGPGPAGVRRPLHFLWCLLQHGGSRQIQEPTQESLISESGAGHTELFFLPTFTDITSPSPRVLS